MSQRTRGKMRKFVAAERRLRPRFRFRFGGTNLCSFAMRYEADMGKAAASKRVSRSRHRERPDPLAARIGQRIRQLRTDAEFPFDAFVEETGLGRGYVSELERGLVVPGVGTLARVSAALGVTIADLVCGDTDRERLFDELRGRPAALVRTLRDTVRKETKDSEK